MICPTSRYLTFREPSHSETARAVSIASRIKPGRANIPHVGRMRNHAIMPMRMIKEITKSTIPDTTAEIGSRSRGKYTFETRLELPTTLVVPRVSAPANRLQGSNAVKEKTSYG